MSRKDIEDYFAKIGQWMKADIARELKLAELSSTPVGRQQLSELGIPLGGGNMLMALGLVAYTEALGRLKMWNFERRRAGDEEACFNALFDRMAEGRYRAWWDSWKGRPAGKSGYDVLRSGLVHEYHPKVPSNIHIGSSGALGLDDHNGRLVFNARPYYDDFCAELAVLREQLVAKTNPEAEIPPPSGFWTEALIEMRFGPGGAVASGADLRRVAELPPTSAVASGSFGPVPPRPFVVSPTSQASSDDDDKVG